MCTHISILRWVNYLLVFMTVSINQIRTLGSVICGRWGVGGGGGGGGGGISGVVGTFSEM